MATLEEAKQAIIDEIARSAEKLSDRTSEPGVQLKAMAEALETLKKVAVKTRATQIY